jgi:hypothetical protein
MRAGLINALREYYADADDAVGEPMVIAPRDENDLPRLNPQRFERLVLRALREIEQDRIADRQAAQAAIADLRTRVAALEGA